jgi:hypothetical protein
MPQRLSCVAFGSRGLPRGACPQTVILLIESYRPPNREAIEARAAYLIESRLWPAAPALNVHGWLSNFHADDLDFAYALLSSFLFIPNRWTDELFTTGLRDLSRSVCNPADPFVTQQRTWRRFLSGSIVTYITGETPNPTDSGYTFARKARQVAGFPEASIMHPDRAFIEARDRGRHVIFVDDFVGSGSQTIATWHRRYASTNPASFAELAANGSNRFFYSPLVMASLGKLLVDERCVGLECSPVHTLDSSHNALDPNTRVWPLGMRDAGVDFIRRVSTERGVPDTAGKSVDDWRGFAALGLCFAFEHSIPDATLPIFRWEEDGWIPLMRRL